MRHLLVMVFSMLSIALYAGFSPLAQLPLGIPDGAMVEFGPNDAVQVVGQDIYLTYLQHTALNRVELMFAHSTDNGQNFTVTEVADSLQRYNTLMFPTISVGDNTLFIEWGMNTYISMDNGVTFTTNASSGHLTYPPVTRITNGMKYGFRSNGETLLPGSFMMRYNTSAALVTGESTHFTGIDYMRGRVHENDGLYLDGLHQGGWPCFYSLASTAGYISFIGDSTDYSIFHGGYEARSPMHENGGPEISSMTHFWPDNDPDVDIVMVNLDGAGGFTSYVGNIVQTRVDTLTIYDCYPPFGAVGDSIGVNYVPCYDTLWTPSVSGSAAGLAVYVPCTLWIRGVCSGNQTWYSPDNVYIVGELTYAGTEIGNPPDGLVSGELQYPVNTTDFLTLASDHQIMLKYAFVDPVDGVRKHVSYGSEGIYIYAMLIALHQDETPQENGAFTFEYQHVHRSTPNCTYNGQLYTDIDLHLCKFPPDSTHHWPWPADSTGGFQYPTAYGVPAWPDYPYYNPIWPEAVPYNERGTIHFFGGIAAEAKGYIHRSSFDPQDMGYWDIDQYMYGQTSSALGQDAPGVGSSTDGIGYQKDYHYDYRLIYTELPGIGLVTSRQTDDVPAYTLLDMSHPESPAPISELLPNDISGVFGFDAHDQNLAAFIDHRLLESTDGGTTWATYNLNGEYSPTWHQVCYNDTLYFCDSTQLYSWDAVQQAATPILLPDIVRANLNLCGTQPLTLAATDGNDIELFRVAHNTATRQYVFSPTLDEQHTVALAKNELDSLYVFAQGIDGDHRNIYFSHGTLGTVANSDVTVPPSKVTLQRSPNPFNPNLTIRYSLPIDARVKLEVYNLRGQWVTTLVDTPQNAGSHQVLWNATDARGNAVASGVYLLRLQTGSTILTQKALLLK